MTASVLVVEDERKIRELVRGYLEREGLQVITTGSGAEAIEIARRSRDGSAGLDVASYGGGEVVVDEAQHAVTVRGEPVELTPTEWGLLVALAGTPGRVYSRFELVNRVRGYEFEG